MFWWVWLRLNTACGSSCAPTDSQQTHTHAEVSYTHLIASWYLPTNSVLTLRPWFSLRIESIKICTLEIRNIRIIQAAHHYSSWATRGQPNKIRGNIEFEVTWLSETENRISRTCQWVLIFISISFPLGIVLCPEKYIYFHSSSPSPSWKKHKNFARKNSPNLIHISKM